MLTLTQRELEIARLISQELSQRQIAERLTITPRTVQAHVWRISSKLGCTGKVGIAVWFVKQDTVKGD